MDWQGGNKQRPSYWQWRRSFILGDLKWKSFQVSYPVDMYLSPNWMLSRVRSVKNFFWKCFEQSTSWCFGSHFFVARSHRLIAICHCRFLASFLLYFCSEQSTSWCFGSHFFVARSHRFIAICHCRFLASFLLFYFLKEKHGKKTPLSTFHCNQLQHTRLACFKTDLPEHFWFNFVQVITEPCGSVVLLWRHGGHVTETWDFQLQMTQMLEASCLFSFKWILLCTSGKCQSIKRTACMLNFIYIVQSKWYLRLKISVQGPFKGNGMTVTVMATWKGMEWLWQ